MMDYLSLDNPESKLRKRTKFSVFAEIVRTTFLSKLQGKNPSLEYSELIRLSGWSRPYLNAFLDNLQKIGAIAVCKNGNKKTVSLMPEILSESSQIINSGQLPAGNISEPSDPSQIVSGAKESGKASSGKEEN